MTPIPALVVRVLDLAAGIFFRRPRYISQKRATARHLPGGDLMESKFDRRSFLRVAGTSLSIGALYSVFAPLAHGAGNEVLTRTMAELQRRGACTVFVHPIERHPRWFQWTARSARHPGVRKRRRNYQQAQAAARAGNHHRRPDPRRRLSRRARQALQAVQADRGQDSRRASQGRAGRERRGA